MALNKQMEMFEDGGLKDEGGMIDEVSGNDVPSGSTREEVRDDIPAQLSEGEFVFPADVVRYIGLEKLMTIRQEAKQGLKQMEAMGQMGNSEEATMPDDLPFDINDLDMEESVDNESEMGYNRGGVIEAQQGTFVQTPVTLGQAQFNNQGIDPNTQGMQQIQQNLARGVYQPNVGRMYGGQGYQQQTPVSFKDLLGTSSEGPPQTELVNYYNPVTGQTRMIPHLVNADGTRGESIYPIPKDFEIKEPTKEEEKKQPDQVYVPSTNVTENDSDGDDSGVGDLGGARTTIGKEEYAISYGLDGTVSITSVSEYNKTGKTNFTQVTPAIAEAIKNQTIGQITQLGKAFGLKGTAAMEIAKKMGIDTPRYDKLGNKITKGIDATSFLKNIKNKDEKAIFGREVGMFSERQGFDSMSKQDMVKMQEDMERGGTEKFTEKDIDRLGLAFDRKEEKDRQEAQAKKEKEEREAYLAELEAQKTAAEQKRQADNIAKQKEASRKAYEAMLDRQRREQDNNNNNDDGSQSTEDQSSVADQQGGMFTAVGGLADKKKLILRKRQPKKTKRMKRGGLASKK